MLAILNIPGILALHRRQSMGAFLVTDNHIFTGPHGRSLRSFARTAQSFHGAPLCYARFTCLLSSRARSLTSLTRGTVEIYAENAFHGKKRVFGRH